MFYLICVPMPSSKRPPDIFCRSQAASATFIGLRGKTISTEVPTLSREVADSAWQASSRPSWIASDTNSC